jgi:transcription elongation GreA/GreB family factor
MSRAFVRESDQETETLPERLISPHPNLVTPAGMRHIDAQIRDLESARKAARSEADRSTLARIARDLRYWNQRRATARVVETAAAPDAARFGVQVTLELEDGTQRKFRIVGEDEADPARGLVSWVSPLGEALLGARLGETVRFQDRNAEIVGLEV